MLSSRLLAAAVILLAPAAFIVDAGAQPVPERGAGAAGSLEPQVTVAARVRQRGTLTMHPQLSQPGTVAASSASAKSSMAATFRPIRSGRKVLLQRRQGRRWVSVATARQNGAGLVEFNAPYRFNNAFATYRAVTVRYRGLASKLTNTARTDRWGAPDFTDEFAGTSLSPHWSHRGQDYGHNDLRNCAKSDPRAISVGGGAVRLSVIDDPDRLDNLDVTRCPVTKDGVTKYYDYRLNGHISTSGRQNFRYGYAAARMKFQPSAGQHASFWMQPDPSIASSDAGAEIDVIEWFGNRPSDNTELTSFAYKKHPSTGVNTKYGGYIRGTSRYGNNWAGVYHVFSVEWTPRSYTFRIDGKVTSRITDLSAISMRHEFLILSLLSSDYELERIGSDGHLPEPQHMYVDWVRFWDRQR